MQPVRVAHCDQVVRGEASCLFLKRSSDPVSLSVSSAEAGDVALSLYQELSCSLRAMRLPQTCDRQWLSMVVNGCQRVVTVTWALGSPSGINTELRHAFRFGVPGLNSRGTPGTPSPPFADRIDFAGSPGARRPHLSLLSLSGTNTFNGAGCRFRRGCRDWADSTQTSG